MEGGDRLLPGERFCPMEDELLMFYLKPKVNGKLVPGNQDLICELDLYGDQDPWKIWARFEARKANDLRRNKDLYFFTQKKKKSTRSSRISRTVGSGGTWKGQNAAKEVYLLDHNHRPTTTLLGFKKTYTYKNKGSVHDGRWIMYEFELDESQVVRKKQVNKNDYVLCLLRKNDILKEKKRKRQEEDMLADYVEEEYGDDGEPDSVTEEPQEKRQRFLPSMEAEQEQLLLPAPSLEVEQEAVATPLEDGQLFLQVNECMGVNQAEVAELLKWMEQEFETRPTTLEAEQVALPVDEDSSGPQQLEAETQPGEENMEQQLEGPLLASDEIMNGLQFPPDENPVEQMGAEANVYGGNSSDPMVGEDRPMSFMEELRFDEQPMNTMEVGDWTAAAYSHFS